MLDSFDRQILQALEKDARRPYAEIANQLGISNTMVHQRVAKLKQRGLLKGTSIVVDERMLGYEWGAFTGLILKEDSDSLAIVDALRQIPEVVECYYITGQYALYIRIIAQNREHMRQILYDQIDHIPGILKTESLIDFGCAFKKNIPIPSH